MTSTLTIAMLTECLIHCQWLGYIWMIISLSITEEGQCQAYNIKLLQVKSKHYHNQMTGPTLLLLHSLIGSPSWVTKVPNSSTTLSKHSSLPRLTIMLNGSLLWNACVKDKRNGWMHCWIVLFVCSVLTVLTFDRVRQKSLAKHC